MTISMHRAAVPVLVRLLTNLKHVLAKGEAHAEARKVDPSTLLNARLALLTRDEAGYREDLRVAQGWVQRYFDARAKSSLAALAQMRQLSSASISFEPPSLVDSLEAVRGFKTRREQGRS